MFLHEILPKITGNSKDVNTNEKKKDQNEIEKIQNFHSKFESTIELIDIHSGLSDSVDVDVVQNHVANISQTNMKLTEIDVDSSICTKSIRFTSDELLNKISLQEIRKEKIRHDLDVHLNRYEMLKNLGIHFYLEHDWSLFTLHQFIEALQNSELKKKHFVE